MFTSRFRPARAGFTIIEAIFVLVFVVVLVGVLLPALQPHGCGNRQLTDSFQLRGVFQGMSIWAQSNEDRYPLPSLLDTSDATVPELANAKDTSANIFSVLVYNSFFTPDLLGNPAEANPNIARMENYQYDAPAAAVDPAHALWDPALRADFTGQEPGNLSYAHTLPQAGPGPFDRAIERWGASLHPMQAVVGDRGPEITALKYGRRGSVTPTYRLGPGNKAGSSLTFLIHGSRTKWEGNIAYNDGSVDLAASESPEGWVYTTKTGESRPDVLFFDEPDAANGSNNFLGIYTGAGPEKGDFKSIWD